MKYIFSIVSMIIALSMNAQSMQFSVKVTNDWTKEKKNCPIVIKLNEVKGLNFDAKSAKVSSNDGKAANLLNQLDDIDGDNRNDELAFIVDVPAKKTLTYNIELSSKESNETVTPKVYADMMLEDKKSKYPLITSLEAPGESYLYNDLYHHGAAFENEYVAYRIYFDQRQNIDIYGKKLRRLELADTHFYTTPEQMKQDYGNDVLWAGNSVGCGSFKGWDGKAPTNVEPVKTRGQRIVANGPLRTIVEVKDVDWNGLNVKQYYTLYTGSRECEVKVVFDKPLADERFSTGVQKIGSTPEGFVHEDGLAASWGSDYPEMGKKEQFPPEAVGLAVLVPKEYIKETTVSDLNYLFVVGKSSAKTANNIIRYYVTFCADKEKDGYHDAKSWFNYLENWKEDLLHELKVVK